MQTPLLIVGMRVLAHSRTPETGLPFGYSFALLYAHMLLSICMADMHMWSNSITLAFLLKILGLDSAGIMQGAISFQSVPHSP